MELQWIRLQSALNSVIYFGIPACHLNLLETGAEGGNLAITQPWDVSIRQV
jgi:hypothetical protein